MPRHREELFRETLQCTLITVTATKAGKPSPLAAGPAAVARRRKERKQQQACGHWCALFELRYTTEECGHLQASKDAGH